MTNKLRRSVEGLLGVFAIVLILPASAIENPADNDAIKEKDNKAATAEPQKNKVKKIAMIGLGGSAASETLSVHLGLEQGEGLTIYHVVPGSAAAKAGFEVHDVLTHFQGKKIGSQQDLRAAVLAQKPGDVVTVKYIHKGKHEQKKILLGERADLPQARQNPMGGFKFFQGGMNNLPAAERKRIEKMLEDSMKQWRKQVGQNPNGGGMPLADLQRLLQGMQGVPAAPRPQGKKGMLMDFISGASVTMIDQDGSVTIKTVNGKKEVIVKDKAGKVQFEGPYQTEQDKAAVPDDIQKRLERLDSVEIAPGKMLPPPLPLPNEEPDKDEASE